MTSRYNDSMINELAAFFLPRDGWRDWTPTITQSVAVAVNIAVARYVVLAKTVILHANISANGAGVAANTIIVGGIPTAIQVKAPVDGLRVIGTGLVDDVGVAVYTVSVEPATSTSLRFWGYNVANLMGVTPNFALAAGDIISFTCIYERA